MARLPIQRLSLSGANVPCWKIVGVPLGFRTSYHRTAVFPPDVSTVWLATSDAWSPKLRYASRYISRSPSESSFSVVPGCGMQSCVVRHGDVNGATPAIEVGPTSVELLVLPKSTCIFHRFKAPDAGSTLMRKFGEPAGGAVAPSWSDGSRLAYWLLRSKQTFAGACTPAIIPTRSSAQTSGPVKAPPPEKIFHVT